jgi:hypothetical protein
MNTYIFISQNEYILLHAVSVFLLRITGSRES